MTIEKISWSVSTKVYTGLGIEPSTSATLQPDVVPTAQRGRRIKKETMGLLRTRAENCPASASTYFNAKVDFISYR